MFVEGLFRFVRKCTMGKCQSVYEIQMPVVLRVLLDLSNSKYRIFIEISG